MTDSRLSPERDPETAEEVARWLLESDAYSTSTHEGFALHGLLTELASLRAERDEAQRIARAADGYQRDAFEEVDRLKAALATARAERDEARAAAGDSMTEAGSPNLAAFITTVLRAYDDAIGRDMKHRRERDAALASLAAARAEGRAEGLEEAAKECDGAYYTSSPTECARRIRRRALAASEATR